MMKNKTTILVSAALFGAFILLSGSFFSKEKVDYNTEVKPLLNKHCIVCHGGVKQNGGFSLLFRDSALKAAKSGKIPIVPGDASKSEFIKRINNTDPEERMPFKKEPLTAAEIATLTRWVNEGALWGTHWAYQSLQPVAVPGNGFWDKLMTGLGLKKKPWGANEVDAFVEEQWHKEKMQPSIEADKSVLYRRLCLDLTGLPPTPEGLQTFLKDARPEAHRSP